MAFTGIHMAHDELVAEVADATINGANPIPITVVSVADEIDSQLVVFDGQKFDAREVAKRLRLSADLIEREINK